jgi:hypothetical protein
MRAFTLACLCLLFTACSWGDGSGASGDDSPTPDALVPKCGDGVCAPSEIGNCAADCGSQQGAVCGNHNCEIGENTGNCMTDCPAQTACPNGTCDTNMGENSTTCPQDCPSSACPTDPNTCIPCAFFNLGCPAGLDMNGCVQCILGGGGGMCTGGFPDGVCDAAENATNCPFDCP